MRFKFLPVKKLKHKKSYAVMVVNNWPLGTEIGKVFWNEKYQKWTAIKPTWRSALISAGETWDFVASAKVGSFKKRYDAAQRIYELTVVELL